MHDINNYYNKLNLYRICRVVDVVETVGPFECPGHAPAANGVTKAKLTPGEK